MHILFKLCSFMRFHKTQSHVTTNVKIGNVTTSTRRFLGAFCSQSLLFTPSPCNHSSVFWAGSVAWFQNVHIHKII